MTARASRGLFVTGTDTGVGKTVLSAAIVAGLHRSGVAARALKPLLTGLDDPPDPVWPRDHELLALACGAEPQHVAMATYGPAVSPHLAAELAASPIDRDWLRAQLLSRLDTGPPTVIEGVGGLLVPLGEGYDIRSLALDLGLPVVVAARPGLGTINHTLLTIEAARAAGLNLVGVVITPWPPQPDAMTRSNRETIERLGGVEVSVLPELAGPDVELLADAGRQLPLKRWLSG